ncbi:citrate synthase [Kutzneria sp. CA-103260]|uniref:citrate synthase n=1 Tax=Kutzneria sp. CA-103260 TaxID=2802641 RepID=UPI001BF1658F|nr:citrate synthase [Kutzneria sp. CA-103260]QUQ72201.1 helix-turn-helix domain-containing protein [Kutzneria sp. CA-103260]
MASGSDERYLTTAEVARRLGVKTATVYAYASRGMLRSTRLPGRRGSFFEQDEIDEFVANGRDGRQPSGAVERIRTELTMLDDDLLFYRGLNVGELALTVSFEAVAGLLWTGELDRTRAFHRYPKLVDTVRTALAALPPETGMIDAMKVAVAVLGAVDPLRFDLSTPAVVRVGQKLISVLVDALPRGGMGTAGDGEAGRTEIGPAGSDRDDAGGGAGRTGDDQDDGVLIAERLAGKLGGRPIDIALLNIALVLLADHDLAASTVAARVAASARAHPYAVVSAGLGAVDGRYHGVQSTLAYRFLAEAMDNPLRAIAERQRAGGIPGFGHRIYQQHDPRADVLLGLLRGHPDAAAVMPTVDTVIIAADSFPNVDLALAALMHAYDLRPDAGETIFALARTAGWLAHAIEEYREPGLRFRPLGVYTGDRPER